MNEQRLSDAGSPIDNPLFDEFITSPSEKAVLLEEVKYLPRRYRYTVPFLALYITAVPTYIAVSAALTAGVYKLFGGSGLDGACEGAFFGLFSGIALWAVTHDYLVQGLPRKLIDKRKKKREEKRRR